MGEFLTLDEVRAGASLAIKCEPAPAVPKGEAFEACRHPAWLVRLVTYSGMLSRCRCAGCGIEWKEARL